MLYKHSDTCSTIRINLGSYMDTMMIDLQKTILSQWEHSNQ